MNMFSWLKSRYTSITIFIALFLVFDLSVLILDNYVTEEIEHDASAVNMAGRQRMLSQRMSKLVFQMHYTPVGETRTDRSSIGLYFADDADVKEMVITQEATNRRFAIPPGDPAYKVEATSSRAPVPVKILALMPHMHLRGKDFQYRAHYPNGKSEILLNVPAYDFNWQHRYSYFA